MTFVGPAADDELARVAAVLHKLKTSRLEALARNDPVETLVAIQALIDATEAEMQELRKGIAGED